MSSEEAVKVLKDMRDEIRTLTDPAEIDSIHEQALNHAINALTVLNCLGDKDGTSN